jgi:dTMP kinase
MLKNYRNNGFVSARILAVARSGDQEEIGTLWTAAVQQKLCVLTPNEETLTKAKNVVLNMEQHLNKQEKREKALVSKPVKLEVGKVNLTKMSEEELKKELGRLALLKQAKEAEAIRLKDEETRRLERLERDKVEAETAAKQAEIDRAKTEEKKAKELKALKEQRAAAKKASELTQRLIEQQKRRDAMFARQEQIRKAADSRKSNLITKIEEMRQALGF